MGLCPVPPCLGSLGPWRRLEQRDGGGNEGQCVGRFVDVRGTWLHTGCTCGIGSGSLNRVADGFASAPPHWSAATGGVGMGGLALSAASRLKPAMWGGSTLDKKGLERAVTKAKGAMGQSVVGQS